jgi:hypothetical protein
MTQHPEHLISKLGVLKECATVLRAEHNVEPDLRQRLWHGVFL